MEPFVRTNCKKRISLKPSEFNLLDYFEKKLIEDPTVSITKLQKLLTQNSHILHSFVELGGLSKIKEWLSTYLHRNDEESILSWLKILNHENFPFDYDIVIELGLGLLVNDIQQRFPKCQSLACSIRDKWTEQGTKWSNMKAVRRVRHKKAKNKIKNGSLNSSVEFNNGTNSTTNGDCNKENNNNNSDNSSSNTNTINNNNNNNSSNNNSEECEPKTVQFEDSQLEIAVSFRKSDAPMTVSTKNNKNNNNNNGSMENRQNNSTKSILKKVSMFDRRGNSNVNIRGSDGFDKEMSNENGSVNSTIDGNENDNENDNDNDINDNDPLNFDCDLDLEKERRIFEQQHLNNSQNSNSNSNVNSSKINSFEVEIEDDDIKLDDLVIGKDNKNKKGINGLMIENGSKDNNNINKKGKKKEIEGLFDDDDDDEDEDEDDEEGEIEDDDIDIDIKESKGNENKNGNGNETIVRKNRIKIPSSNIKQNGNVHANSISNNSKRRRSDEVNQNCNNSNNSMNNNRDNNNKNNGKNERSRRIRYDNSNEHRILRLNREKELETNPIFRECKREIPWQKPEKMHLPENTCFCKYRMKYLSNSADQTYISEVASQEQIRQRRTPEKIYKERKDIPDNPRNVKTNYQLSNENDKNENDKNEKGKEVTTVDILLEYKYVSSNTQYNIAEQFIKSSFH